MPDRRWLPLALRVLHCAAYFQFFLIRVCIKLLASHVLQIDFCAVVEYNTSELLLLFGANIRLVINLSHYAMDVAHRLINHLLAFLFGLYRPRPIELLDSLYFHFLDIFSHVDFGVGLGFAWAGMLE